MPPSGVSSARLGRLQVHPRPHGVPLTPWAQKLPVIAACTAPCAATHGSLRRFFSRNSPNALHGRDLCDAWIRVLTHVPASSDGRKSASNGFLGDTPVARGVFAPASGDFHGIDGPRHNPQVGADVVQLAFNRSLERSLPLTEGWSERTLFSLLWSPMINALPIGHLDAGPLP